MSALDFSITSFALMARSSMSKTKRMLSKGTRQWLLKSNILSYIPITWWLVYRYSSYHVSRLSRTVGIEPLIHALIKSN